MRGQVAAGLRAPGPARVDERLLFDPRHLRPPLLRWPAPRYLLAGDLTAFAVSRLPHWDPRVADVAALAVLVTCLHLRGLYRSRLSLSLLDDCPRLLGAWVAALATELSARTLHVDVTTTRAVLEQAAALLVALLVVRGAAYAVVRRARARGAVRHTALVVGAGHVGIRLARMLQEHEEYGLDPVGFVDARPRVEALDELPAPLFGGYEQLTTVITDFAVKVVVVAFGTMREADLVAVLRTCDRLRCEILFVPRLFEVHPASRDTDDVRGIPLIRVRRAPFRTPSWRVKRLVDVVCSSLALVFLSPVMALCALAVRLEGGPGVLFHQMRVGLDGRPFDVLKFRSLKPVDDAESASTWSISHDHRLGPVGRFLRQTSLDELPQLWNILTGDMSVVGPRPERPLFVEDFSQRIPRYTARHRVPSGLTGWAQVNGLRGDTSIEDRAIFDNYYVENWSLWMDCKIILRTVGQVLRRQGS